MAHSEKLEPAAFFSRYPVFRLETFAAALGKNRPRAMAQVRYYATAGRLRNVVRGVYAVVPPDRQPEGFEPDRYLVAAATRDDACFCAHAALELLGLGHSLWAECSAYSARRHPSVALATATIRFLPVPRALAEAGTSDLGTTSVERLGASLRLTGRERTLVEGLRSPGRVGGLGELIECFASVRTLRLELVESLVSAYGEAKLWAATGWYLEQNARRFGIDDATLRAYEMRRPGQRTYLDRSRSGGRLARRWNLIVPEELAGTAGRPNVDDTGGNDGSTP